MDNNRLFLVIALSFTAFMLWDAWQRDYHTPQLIEVDRSGFEEPTIGLDIDDTQVVIPSTASLAFESTSTSSKTISVVTDLLDVDINLVGGGITRGSLLATP
jgi:YidC/Oxa1 family membrane protein insertase